MSEVKHTPGKWEAKLSKGLSSVRCDGVQIASLINARNEYSEDLRNKGESWLDFRDRTKPLRERHYAESEANALLIAAAPELLEALKDVYNDLRQGAIPNDISFIESAIKKAESL